MKKVYFKLVRDKIPQKIKDNGETAIVLAINVNAVFETLLFLKLEEEIDELKKSSSIEQKKEELSDILEVVESISTLYGLNLEDVYNFKKIKKDKCGGFDNRSFLIETF